MQLKSRDIAPSPVAPDRVRLSGEVTYDRGPIRSEVYWFDVPERYAASLSVSGNPWLVCLIPLAVTLGEPLRICEPVDRRLLENVAELMRIWKCWYPHLHVVPLEAESVESSEPTIARKIGAFFSGGVDSFFTALWHADRSESAARVRIDDLLTVWGFDVPLANVDAFRRMRDVLRRAAEDLGIELIDVATNVRDTRWQQTDWTYLSHNCALGGVALALEGRYRKMLMASTGGYRDLLPWGSHVLTDPLLSTSMNRDRP